MKGSLNSLGVIFALALAAIASAQPRFLWSSYRDLENVSGGTGTGWSVKVLQRPGGGFYSLGYSYLARFDDNGVMVWNTHHLGFNLNMCLVPGGVAIVNTNQQDTLACVYEVDDNGKQLWSNNVAEGYSPYNQFYPIISDATGALYLSTGTKQLFKYSSSGALQWSQSDPTWTSAYSIALSGSNVVVGGGKSGGGGFAAAFTADGNPVWTQAVPSVPICAFSGPSSSILMGGGLRAYKLDANGNILWQTSIPFGMTTMATNSSGNVAVSSNTNTMLIDATGNVLWNLSTGGRYPAFFGLTLDSQNNVCMSGQYPLYDAPGASILKLDVLGNTVFDKNFPSESTDEDGVNSIFITSSGGVVGVASLSTIGPNSPFITYQYATLFALDAVGNQLWYEMLDLGGSTVTTLDCRTETSGVNYVLSAPAMGPIYGSEATWPRPAAAPIVVTRFMPSGRAAWSVKVSPASIGVGGSMQLSPGGGVVLAGAVTSYDSSTDEFHNTGHLLRYNDAGKLAWTKSYAQDLTVHALATSSSAIYIACQTAGVSTTTVMKYDANGNLIWSTNIPVPFSAFDGQLDSAGNLYLVGGDGQDQAAVTKLSASGVYQWIYSLANDQPNDNGLQIAVDAFGVYARVKVESALGGYADEVLKLDFNGNLLWQTTPTTLDYDMGFTRIAPDRTGGVYIGGLMNGATPPRQMFLRRVDANGNTMWTYPMPGFLPPLNQKMITDGSGAVYATADGSSPSTGSDFAVMKLLPDGTTPWPTSGTNFRLHALFFDSLSCDDNTMALGRDPLNNLYVGGSSFGLTGNQDINLLKFGSEHSQFISQSFPSTMLVGHAYNVSVTFKNTGTTTWTAAKGYRLVPVYAKWSVTSVALGVSDSIAPGQSKTFTFTVTAPSSKGIANSRWTMQRSSTMFGAESSLVAVNVS